MSVDIPDAWTEQPMTVDQSEHPDIGRRPSLREVAEQTENLAALREMPESKFTGHPWMGENLSDLK